MTKELKTRIYELENMKKYPNKIFYRGNLSLLQRPKISIVSTRRPNQYTQEITRKLSSGVIYNNKLKSTKINLNGVSYED